MIAPAFDGFRLRKASLGLALVLVVAAIALCAGVVRGAVPYVVVSNADGPEAGDTLPGDGVCASKSSPHVCTLRAAIEETNARAGADVISFALGASRVTILLTDELTITDGLVINGPGTDLLTLDGNSEHRHLVIDSPSGPVSISGLTLANGRAPAYDDSGGGAIRFSHDPSTTCTGTARALNLDNVIIRNSQADRGGALSVFVGSYSTAVLSVNLRDVTLEHNSAKPGFGGAIALSDWSDCVGAAVGADIAESKFKDNDAQYGGAIANGGTLTIARSSFDHNTAIYDCEGACGDGGAIDNFGSLAITESTFSANEAIEWGGAIANEGDTAGSTLTITNSTLSGNKAAYGGGISNISWYSGTTGTVDISHSTITLNEATMNGGGIYVEESSGGTAILRIGNTILAGNAISGGTNLDHYRNLAATAPAGCVSLGYNLTTIGGSIGCSFTALGDLLVPPGDVFTQILASILLDNGGSAQTHFLLPGSPAIDHIPSGVNGCGTDVVVDERGVPRPVGTKCDIGAYETIPMGVTLRVTAVGTEQAALRTVTATVTYLGGVNLPVPGQLVGFLVTEGTMYGPKASTTKSTGQAVFQYLSVAPQNQRVSSDVRAQSRPRVVPDAPTDMDSIQVWVEQNGNYVRDDFEPEFVVELPTAITLASFTAQPNADGTVTLQWKTAAEIDNAGFNLWRATTANGEYARINPQLIPGQGTGWGADYSYVDAPAGPGSYFYKLEDVDYNDVGTFHGPVEVRVSASGHWYRYFLPIFQQ